MGWWIDTRDKPGLLWAFLRLFENDSRVSFEGRLEGLDLISLVGASTQETAILHRQTLVPELDFISVPVTTATIRSLQERFAVGGLFGDYGPIIHVQVEHGGQLVLGAYDNFHKDCVVVNEPTPEIFLSELKAKGVIRSYEVSSREHR